MIKFCPISKDEHADYANWVENHPAGTLLHTLPWINFICTEQGGMPRIYRIVQNGEFYGYWPFIQVKKGPFKLLGSPLQGWMTQRMGPLLQGPAEPELISALKQLCLKERITYFETASELLKQDMMESSGFFTKIRGTWLLPLSSDLTEQWEKLHYNCKKNIKKAQRNKIEVRQLHDDTYLRPLYDLVVKTYERRGLAVPYHYKRYKHLEILKNTIDKANRSLFLGAFYGDTFVGGHIWGYDKKTAYALVSASKKDFDQYRINNILLWEGIEKFITIGLETYDMYGGSKSKVGTARFKSSFGSTYQERPLFRISFSKIFSALLYFYENHYMRCKKHASFSQGS